MYQSIPLGWLALLPALASLTVSAQTAPSIPAASPAQSQATPAPYRSSLEDYRSYSDEKLTPWKQANDTVGKVGGWRAYAKEAQGPQAPGSQAPGTGGASNPHAGHGKP